MSVLVSVLVSVFVSMCLYFSVRESKYEFECTVVSRIEAAASINFLLNCGFYLSVACIEFQSVTSRKFYF